MPRPRPACDRPTGDSPHVPRDFISREPAQRRDVVISRQSHRGESQDRRRRSWRSDSASLMHRRPKITRRRAGEGRGTGEGEHVVDDTRGGSDLYRGIMRHESPNSDPVCDKARRVREEADVRKSDRIDGDGPSGDSSNGFALRRAGGNNKK